jgi:hypothetical protein
MTSPHAHILDQLAAGQISSDEAAARMRGEHTAAAPRPTLSAAAMAGRWLHVRVTDLHTGRQRVQVNLPLTLVAAGLQIGARYTPQLGQLDLGQILADIHAGTSGRLVEVEDLDDGQRVEIFVD